MPESVKDIIHRFIRSVADLEALLLVSSEPHRDWHPSEISHALYITGSAAEAQLTRLAVHGLLLPGERGTYRYAPQDEGVRAAIAELAVVYEQWRVRVIEYIYSSPSDSVRSFAHAFRFKGDSES